MINFVICEDESILAKEYKNEIDKFMMNYDNEYIFKFFDGYTEEWKKFARTNTDFKIYLLDIKTNKGSGLDAARLIREVYEDWNSMIIIITSYTEYRYDALTKRLMLVDFINKLDDCSKYLQEALSICMKHYDKRPKVLKYTYKGNIYNIDFKNIVYAEKEIESKLCKIYTSKESYTYPGTLTKLLNELDNRFIKISRSTIINTRQVKRYDIKKNSLLFRTGIELEDISRDKRKDLIKCVRGLS